MARPRIGITKPAHGEWFVHAAIAAGVLLAGGMPVILSEKHRRSPSDVDGLIFSGGLDVHPHLYEKKPDPETRYDDRRDELEMAWAQFGWKHNMPMLGICRGAQLLNVSRGGDLHQVIDKSNADKFPSGLIGYAFFRKRVEVAPRTRLRKLLRRPSVEVNSLHRQAVNSPGDGLLVSACESEDGGVQAIEAEADHFLLGVQFHPELLLYRSDMRRLFRALVSACRIHRAKPEQL